MIRSEENCLHPTRGFVVAVVVVLVVVLVVVVVVDVVVVGE